MIDLQTILLEDKQGMKYCIACRELDTDTDKDDPGNRDVKNLGNVKVSTFIQISFSQQLVLIESGKNILKHKELAWFIAYSTTVIEKIKECCSHYSMILYFDVK